MKIQKINRTQLWMLMLVWASHACAYMLRRPLSIIKSNIEVSLDLPHNQLGYIELSFSVPYAFGSIFLGFVSEKLGPRTTLGGGLIGSAIATSLMGIYDSFPVLMVLLFFSGLFQSLAGPAAMVIISNVFHKSLITSVMGVFVTSTVVGSVTSTFITVKMISAFSWHYAFIIPSAISFICGVLDLTLLRDDRLMSEEDTDPKARSDEVTMTFWEAFQCRNVMCTSFTMFFLKGIRTAVFFWLPYYLTTVLKYSKSDSSLISLLYEIGSFIGPIVLSTVFNLLVDDITASIITLTFATASVLLIMVVEKKNDLIVLYVSLFCSGAFTSAVDSVFGASFVVKLGEKHNSRASVVSVINGIGSLGNVVEGPLIAHLSNWFGIEVLVPCIVFFCICSLMLTIKLFAKQRKENKVPDRFINVQKSHIDLVRLKGFKTLSVNNL